MYFQYALVANNSTILAEKQLIEWDYRETSLSILENRDPNENVVKFIKHPNRFYSVTKSDGTTFLSVCMSKIPEDIQERFIHDLEESWNEKQRWHVRLFTKKEDFGETQINSLLQRYNFELAGKIQTFKEELEERRKQLEEQKKKYQQKMTLAFKKGEEFQRIEDKLQANKNT